MPTSRNIVVMYLPPLMQENHSAACSLRFILVAHQWKPGTLPLDSTASLHTTYKVTRDPPDSAALNGDPTM